MPPLRLVLDNNHYFRLAAASGRCSTVDIRVLATILVLNYTGVTERYIDGFWRCCRAIRRRTPRFRQPARYACFQEPCDMNKSLTRLLVYAHPLILLLFLHSWLICLSPSDWCC
jgi:hypothetical protein